LALTPQQIFKMEQLLFTWNIVTQSLIVFQEVSQVLENIEENNEHKLKPKSDLTLESDEPHDSANANVIEIQMDEFTQKNINTGKFPNLLRRSELLY